MAVLPGAEPDILIWGATGGASFATKGAVNGLCPIALNNFTAVAWRHAEDFRGQWNPPSSTPECYPRHLQNKRHLPTYVRFCCLLFPLQLNTFKFTLG